MRDNNPSPPVMEGPDEQDPQVWGFRLYLAGDAPQSQRARANLQAICYTYLNEHYEVEVIDLLKEPRRFLEDEILVTPTLIRYTPPPVCRLMGNLSDRPAVLAALGLRETLNGT
jgi:circadian clock protein KaiB